MHSSETRGGQGGDGLVGLLTAKAA